MQGQGEKGCFLGLVKDFKESSVVIHPVAFDKTTTYGHGASKGPSALIEASRNIELYDIETRSEVFKEGIFTAPEMSPMSCQKMVEEVYEKSTFFLNEGKYVVTIGGEHSISFPVIRAHAKRYGPISILQLDAHTDLAPAYEGNPYSHASVMARVKEIPEVDRIISVGIRSMAKEEMPYINENETFWAHTLFENESWMDQVIEQLSDRVYLTLDLDVFDSSIMPATGTPEPGGLDWNRVLKLIKRVIKAKSVIGFDVVELSPIPQLVAPDYLSAKLIYKILSYLFQT